MTIHSAKGLEFDYVFITGMEENLFPSALSVNTLSEIEEERRLFYVALTRARKQVILTCAQTRYRFGSLEFCEESRFLEEIPDRFLNTTKKASSGKGFFSKERIGGGFSSERSTYSKPRPVPSSPSAPHVKSKQEVKTDQIGTLATNDQIQPGVRVYHTTFGFGTVQSTENPNGDARAVVVFDSVGTKTLMLKFAKLIIPK